MDILIRCLMQHGDVDKVIDYFNFDDIIKKYYAPDAVFAVQDNKTVIQQALLAFSNVVFLVPDMTDANLKPKPAEEYQV